MNAPVKKFKQSSRTGTAEPVTQALSSIAFYSELAAASSGQRFIVTAALSSYAKKNCPRLMLALRGDKVRPGRDASCTGVIVYMVLEESGLARRVASDIDGSGRYFKRIAK